MGVRFLPVGDSQQARNPHIKVGNFPTVGGNLAALSLLHGFPNLKWLWGCYLLHGGVYLYHRPILTKKIIHHYSSQAPVLAGSLAPRQQATWENPSQEGTQGCSSPWRGAMWVEPCGVLTQRSFLLAPGVLSMQNKITLF